MGHARHSRKDKSKWQDYDNHERPVVARIWKDVTGNNFRFGQKETLAELVEKRNKETEFWLKNPIKLPSIINLPVVKNERFIKTNLFVFNKVN